MQIAEVLFTVDENGSLTIPEGLLREMGLFPGNAVRVAYLTQDGQENLFQELLLSANPLDELSDEQQVRIPHQLLEQSKIPEDADLQILCLNGCILICQDLALSPSELTSVLESMNVADSLISDIPGVPEQAQEQLEQLINHIQEGVASGDV